MKIRPEIEVFDDAEYCNIDDDNCCDRLIYQEFNFNRPYCPVYLVNLQDKTTEETDAWNYTIIKKFKCDQCKADYLKAQRPERFLGQYKGKDIFVIADDESALDEFIEYSKTLRCVAKS
jgi:hypothetical protein